MFKSVKEFAEAMLQGRKFIFSEEYKNLSRYGLTFFFKEGFKWENKEDCTTGTMDETDFNSFNKVEEYSKPQWHDNIPKQGILCWVRIFPSDRPRLRLVLRYCNSSDYSYVTECASYLYATPATSEEVKQFIYQP